MMKFANIEEFEREVTNSDSINILSEFVIIENIKYIRTDIKSDDSYKYVVYNNSTDKYSWFEIYFNTNPFKFSELVDYTI